MKRDIDSEIFFPNDITPISYGGFLLLVSPSNANWIVLKNQIQVDIIKKLILHHSKKKLIEEFHQHIADVEYIINEIEKRHFCEKMIHTEEGFTLRIYLTNSCNLRCKHCFMYAGAPLENELKYEEIIEILNQSKQHGCIKVIFTGGEVVLKEGFIDILQHAKKLGLYTQVLTNGVLWNSDLVEEAEKYIDEIQVSIDGFDDVTNSAIRGSGTYYKAMETIDRFVKHKNVFVSVITTPLYEMLEIYKDKYIEFGKKMVQKYGSDNFLVIFANELIDGRNLKAEKNKNRIMSKTISDIYEEIYPNSQLTTFVMNHKFNRSYRSCGYGSLTINSNGDFYFCGRIHDVRCYGNIRKMDFCKVLELRKKARELSYVDNITPCKNCAVRNICGGGCRVANVPEMISADLNKNTKDEIFERECSNEYKENIYKLMIESSEFLYW